MRILLLLPILLLPVSSFAVPAPQTPSSVVMDEDVWVTFYDLPSRRFRAIRTAVINRDAAAAVRDIAVATNYLAIEQDRAIGALKTPMGEVVQRLRAYGEDVNAIALGELDATFGRAHWLLAQHYLQLAREAREARLNRATSLYLMATTHHMERAVLWSGVAVNRNVRSTLDDLRDLAGRLQSEREADKVYKERPVVRADALLRRIGEQIDRRVLLPAAEPAPRG